MDGNSATGGVERELEVTGLAQRDAWLQKSWPPVEKVRPDIWSVPVQVPENPIRYTLCYLLIDGTDVVVVDPGWDTDAGWTALQEGMATAGVTPAQVRGIVITHTHPDHHGMSARLRSTTGAWIAMHQAERDSLQRYTSGVDLAKAPDQAWLVEQGMPSDALPAATASEATIEMFRTMAEPDVILADGELLPLRERRIRAVWTPGHTPGHLCLFDEDNDVVFTGDHILPRISPNVGLQSPSAPPPLGPYLNSLRKLQAHESAEVLPAHEWRFRGLGLRIDQLLAHHGARCDEIVAVLADFGPASAWQVTERLTWSRGWAAIQGMQQRAALVETLAHLRYLEDQQRLTADREPGVPALYRV